MTETLFEVETDRRSVTKKTMREYTLFIRSVLNYANENYDTKVQLPPIRAYGRRGKNVDCLHKDEVERLQQTLKECSLLERAIVLSLLNTGVRRGELAGLTWQDVNFKECTIHISKSLLVFRRCGCCAGIHGISARLLPAMESSEKGDGRGLAEKPG